MRKNIYIATQNLSFFYKLNKELLRLRIKFEVLPIRSKIPSSSSIVLTTAEEVLKFEETQKRFCILPYYKNQNFQHYIIKILAAYKIEYKENYSEILFSIDPGTKQIGIVVFLDDYYLQSHTIYTNEEFKEMINDYILSFQNTKTVPITIIFKFGRGVKSITTNLLNLIFETYRDRGNMKVYLVDESKTSKIKIQDKRKQIKSKHEISAIIIAMRKGIEVDKENFLQSIEQNLSQNNRYYETEVNTREDVQEKKNDFKNIIERILNNDISLRKSSKLIKNLNVKLKPRRYDKRSYIRRAQF
ncbi:MAG: hypothetical protein ACFFCC_07630 [Promethearchaeota archaeon]